MNLHSGHDAELLVGDGESQRLVVEEALDVAGNLFNQTQAALGSMAGDVGGEKDVVEIAQGMVGGQGFGLEDVDEGVEAIFLQLG